MHRVILFAQKEIDLDSFLFTKSNKTHKVSMMKPTQKQDRIMKTWTRLDRWLVCTFDSDLFAIKDSIEHLPGPPNSNLMFYAKIVCCFRDILNVEAYYILGALPTIYIYLYYKNGHDMKEWKL